MKLDPFDPDEPSETGPGWRTVAVVAALYIACVSLATWPRIFWFRSALPSLGDPLQHLWIMRWYKTCLREGQSFILCPEIQYPTGAPLGSFSPLHFQSLLYIPLSSAIGNDVLCYNLIWLFGIVFTGLGTFLLIWHTSRDSWCAGFGGMLAMLSGPMMLHAIGHLELIFLGGFPLFLWSWLRFVDRPDRGRLTAAVGLYLLLALISAYFVVYAVFPAALYVAWKLMGTRPREVWPWLRARGGWLAAFAGLVVPGLLLVFGNQLWAKAQGYVLPRPISEFRIHGAPLWSYILPTGYHLLGRFLPSRLYETTEVGENVGECCSYLGMVSLVLILSAGVFRVRFARATYWWSTLLLLIVLSGGASWTLGGYQVSLPALWLKKNFFAFQQIRSPARFNLFASVVAALVAAHGLQHLLRRMRHYGMRTAAFAGLAIAALADLAIIPYATSMIPPMPGCYAFMRRTAPEAAFVEIPQFGSGGSFLYAVCGYWQSLHRGRTNAGYCGQGNALFDNLLTWNSPFSATSLARHDYLVNSDRIALEVLGDVDFRDYAWLYLTAHNFRFAVLHQWPGSVSYLPVRLDRLKAAMKVAKVYEDAGSVVYDRDRLPLPSRLVLITTRGWRPAWDGKMLRVANREARLAVYNPDPKRDIQMRLNAKTFQHARQVRLLSGDKELARWNIRPGEFQPLASTMFRLSSGLSELILASDGESRPRSWRDASLVGDLSPYSLKIERVGLEVSTTLSLQAPR
jgi:hypothetical protein